MQEFISDSTYFISEAKSPTKTAYLITKQINYITSLKKDDKTNSFLIIFIKPIQSTITESRCIYFYLKFIDKVNSICVCFTFVSFKIKLIATSIRYFVYRNTHADLEKVVSFTSQLME